MPHPTTSNELPGAGGVLCAPWAIVRDDDQGIEVADARGQVVWAENYLSLVGELDYDDYVQAIIGIRARFARAGRCGEQCGGTPGTKCPGAGGRRRESCPRSIPLCRSGVQP